MAQAKICGLNDSAGVEAALVGGARYLGFVFFAKSPRHVAPEQARSLAAPARGRADLVAVTVNADDALLADIAETLKPDWIQAHGSENPVRVAAMKRFAGKGVIKALAVAIPADLAEADAFSGPADLLMFDAKAPPGADLPGGNGAAFDWPMLKGRRFSKPYLLSGGLNPANVAEAIQASGASLVDVSSGVETRPGLKDPARIAAFLAAARTAQN
jgi:phosphoribosylanthranilate isomerase